MRESLSSGIRILYRQEERQPPYKKARGAVIAVDARKEYTWALVEMRNEALRVHNEVPGYDPPLGVWLFERRDTCGVAS